MTQRVLLTAGGLKVSLPGYDVTTASVSQMAFDSSYSSGLMTLVSGTLYVGAATREEAGSGGGVTSASIPLGLTLSGVPLVFAQATRPSDGTIFGGGYRHVWHDASDPDWADPNDYNKPDEAVGFAFAVNSSTFYVDNYEDETLVIKYAILSSVFS